MALYGGLQALNDKTNPQAYGVGVWATQVQTGATANGGGAALTVATPFKSVIAAVASLNAAAPPGDNGFVVATSVSGTNVLLERYQFTSGTDPTLVDSTTDLLIDLIVVGQY